MSDPTVTTTVEVLSMALNKDAVIATSIVLVCLALLAAAFSPAVDDRHVADDEAAVVDYDPTMPGLGPDTPTDPLADLVARIDQPAPDNGSSVGVPLPQPEPPAGQEPPEPTGVRIDAPPEQSSSPALADPDENIFAALARQDPLADYDPVTSEPTRPQSEPVASQPPASPQRAAPDDVTGRRHTVARGEILGGISRQYYGTSRHWRRIMEANDIDQPEDLRVGQVLVIPPAPAGTAPTTAEAPASAAASLSDGQRRYRVQRGDSYYIIAQRELGDAARAAELQRLNNRDPYDLKVGQEILLPARGTIAVVESPRSSSAAPATLPRGAQSYTVQRGDILGTISQRFYGTSKRWRAIAEANDIADPSEVRVGQVLVIPALAEAPFRRSAATQTPADTSSRAAGSQRYTIRSRDTLAGIATRIYGDPAAHRRILAANPGLDPRRLAVGQVIVLPGSDDPEPASVPSAPVRDDEQGLRELQDQIRLLQE